MTAAFDEPTIPPRLRRPLAAMWISLGLHVALIALVRVAPPTGVSAAEPVIEARLVSTRAAPPVAEVPPAPSAPQPDTVQAPRLAPVPAESALAEQPPLPVPVAPPPAPTAASQAPVAAPPVASALVPAATLTTSVDLTYYRARDLDVQPRALREIEPDYPEAADRQKLSGKLRLQLKLEADGRVSDIDVVSATPPGVFEDSAIKAFREARFSPAQKNGRPVRAVVLIEVDYDWAGR